MLKNKSKYNVTIVGCTGLIGQTLLSLLEKSFIPIDKLFLFASNKSVGKKIKFKGEIYEVLKFDLSYFDETDIAFFTAPGNISENIIPKIIKKDLIIIDNSSTYRLFKNVPLVVPYVNDHNLSKYSLLSNPNCSTIQAISILKIIDELYYLKEVNYSTYQAVSGSGYKGVIDLEKRKKHFYPYEITKTCIPAIGKLSLHNNTEEENKMIKETQKILNHHLLISATCVRVPVLIGHGIVTLVKTKKKINLDDLKASFNKNPRIIIKDNLDKDFYPTSIDTYNNDKIYVGRFRIINDYELLFYSTSNNILTGAASNSLYICEKIINELKNKNAQ